LIDGPARRVVEVGLDHVIQHPGVGDDDIAAKARHTCALCGRRAQRLIQRSDDFDEIGRWCREFDVDPAPIPQPAVGLASHEPQTDAVVAQASAQLLKPPA
jgi:hypothetical protein